jgi:organic hydroperoxide reductase OsmC/OhrA
MAIKDIAAAMHRVEAILRRRPEKGLNDDAPATARWQSGTRVVTSHSNGTVVQTDMPTELGGSGDQVSPGWLFRSGVASCLATCIAMRAAESGIELAALEVRASSRSDLRGLLGINDATGEPVSAGPLGLQLLVRIRSRGIPGEQLRKLVEESHRCAPMPTALRNALPVELRIDSDVDS